MSLALLLAASGIGCSILDRESYSLVIRKKAHQYELPMKAPPVEAPPPGIPSANAESDAVFVRHDLDALIEPLLPDLEAFRPFAYCHLHHSNHFLESLFAVGVSPVEYPIALTTNFTYLTVDTTIKILLAPLEYLLTPPEKPLQFEDKRKAPTR